MNSGRSWIVFVVILLVANAAAMGFLIAKAGDPTPRVLPDYYRKAVAWDETAAARRASDALGWSTAIELDRSHLTVRLTDRSGAPVAGAAIEVIARHRSRADQAVTLVLDEQAGGVYVGTLPGRQPGLHELALTARRADDTFVASELVER